MTFRDLLRTTASIAVLALASPLAKADEGMWLPSLISQRIEDMQAKGFRLDAEDIYSINQASLKDAVVLFGGGCTGELVSAEGLMLTNHHCGYSYIQKHSSTEHDYLKDGFWAMKRNEELPCPDLWVRFLERMEDVTDAVLMGCSEEMDEAGRKAVIQKNEAALIAEAKKEGNGIMASIESLYYGNTYYLFVFRQYDDVRLVGAPPSSIGKFGGDTDNWMWPRHTGDFSIFRIYSDRDNLPAAYSQDNVPYSPKKFFKISQKGVKEGDFTFIYGYPGSTREYIHSNEIEYVAKVSDPEKIALRTLRLDIQKKHMAQSQDVRIRYSAKNANVANAWKKWQGESLGILKNRTYEQRRDYENRFAKWAVGTRFEGVTEKLDSLYDLLHKYTGVIDIYSESAYTVEIARMASNIVNSNRTPDYDAIYKDYYLPIDEESFVAVMKVFDEKIDDTIKPKWYIKQMKRHRTIEAWGRDLFIRSDFRDKENAVKGTKKDPAYQFHTKMFEWYSKTLQPEQRRLAAEIESLYHVYMKGQMEFGGRDFYPDANLTLRVAYGNVAGYSPADGIWYNPVSTLTGIMEKDNPEIFDYNVPQSLRDIYAKGGYEDQPVCFLATNHTTGGNSGSPVIDADGNLIGINFDRVWEGTMSDISFDMDFCRNISLDVRYLLFVIRNVGHADHLLNEMVFVQ